METLKDLLDFVFVAIDKPLEVEQTVNNIFKHINV